MGRRGHKVVESILDARLKLHDDLLTTANETEGPMLNLVKSELKTTKRLIMEAMNSAAWPAYGDEGTLVEIGMAYCLGKKIILYSPTAQSRINVMLTGAAQGVVVGSVDQLIAGIPKILTGETIAYFGSTQ
jgi:hypothetical protein